MGHHSASRARRGSDEMHVAVVGSANMDLRFLTPSIPAPGETLLATGSTEGMGGKGLNQAVASARMGATTAFLGVLGDDAAARDVLKLLHESAVDASGVGAFEGPTGRAVVMVDERGENAILVAAGANAAFTDLSPTQRALLERCRVAVAQMEIPVNTVAAATAVAHRAGAHVILNAAPAHPLPDELLECVDLLVVNRLEAKALACLDDDEIDSLIPALLRQVPAIVITLGAAGSVYSDRNGATYSIPAIPANAVDTTGAGDTFVGALAAALSLGTEIQQALRYASAAAAIAVSRDGAVDAIPTREEVLKLLRAQREL